MVVGKKAESFPEAIVTVGYVNALSSDTAIKLATYGGRSNETFSVFSPSFIFPPRRLKEL